MSKMVFYMEVKPFLAQWLTYHFGDPVTFPARSGGERLHQAIRGAEPER